MKLLTTLLLAVLAALGVYLVRRRIKLALMSAVVVYLVVLPVRLLFSAGDLADRAEGLILPALVIFGIWVVLWKVSTSYEERRRQERAGGRPPASRR